MGKKPARFSKPVNLIICNITFTVIFYLLSVTLGEEKDITYGHLSVNPEPLNASLKFFKKERFIF